MAVDLPEDRPKLPSVAAPSVATPSLDTSGASTQRSDIANEIMALHGEKLDISRRRVETAVVRATRTTRTREQIVNEELSHERVEVERVPIGRVVDSVPPVRQEGDTTILSVVEEEVVIERRLVLKEEVRVRRVKTTEHHRETVTLREQEATVTRTALEAGSPTKVTLPDQLASKPSINKDPIR